MKNNKIFQAIRNLFDNTSLLNKIESKIKQCIQFQLMFTICVCFFISFIFYDFTNNLLKREYTEPKITYNYDAIEQNASEIISSFENKKSLTLADSEYIEKYINDLDNSSKSAKCFLTDLDGKILFKSSNVTEKSVDIYSILKSAMTNINNNDNTVPTEKNYVIPLKIGNDRVYLIYSAIPDASIKYEVVSISNSFWALLFTFIVFTACFIFITNKKIKYLEEISQGLKIIASGNLNYKIKERGDDEIKNIASNINIMAQEIGKRIELEHAAEKTKTDLITNVSHDLRTPLTSVMGYLGLVLDKRYKNQDEMNEYLNIAFNKSERLKLLIDDLFEYTKLNNNGITLEKSNVNLAEFLSQLIEESLKVNRDLV